MIRIVLIKLDDYSTTGSTGGVVLETRDFPSFNKNYGYFSLEYYNRTGEISSNGDILVEPKPGYLIMQTRNMSVKPGWIYTDKTNILVDSNISTN